jgi:hypothetical protein
VFFPVGETLEHRQHERLKVWNGHLSPILCCQAVSRISLDSTTIDLCLSLCPWAPFLCSRGAVKLRTILDLRGNVNQLAVSETKIQDLRPTPRNLTTSVLGLVDV